jgi:hypothetical protein
MRRDGGPVSPGRDDHCHFVRITILQPPTPSWIPAMTRSLVIERSNSPNTHI